MKRPFSFPDSPIPIPKLQELFRKVTSMVTDLFNAIDNLYAQNGLKYFVKPNCESFLRLVLPYELKVFVDFTDVCWMFENRNEIIRTSLEKEFRVSGSNANNAGKSGFADGQQIMKGFQELKNFQKRQPSISMPIQMPMQMPMQMSMPNNSFNVFENTQKRDEMVNFYRPNYFKGLDEQFPKADRPQLMNARDEMRKVIQKKLGEWVQQAVHKGNKVTRKDVKAKAHELALHHGIVLRGRWFKDYMKANYNIRCLLTHGNFGMTKPNAVSRMSYIMERPNYGMKMEDLGDSRRQSQILNQGVGLASMNISMGQDESHGDDSDEIYGNNEANIYNEEEEENKLQEDEDEGEQGGDGDKVGQAKMPTLGQQIFEDD